MGPRINISYIYEALNVNKILASTRQKEVFSNEGNPTNLDLTRSRGRDPGKNFEVVSEKIHRSVGMNDERAITWKDRKTGSHCFEVYRKPEKCFLWRTEKSCCCRRDFGSGSLKMSPRFAAVNDVNKVVQRCQMKAKLAGSSAFVSFKNNQW